MWSCTKNIPLHNLPQPAAQAAGIPMSLPGAIHTRSPRVSNIDGISSLLQTNGNNSHSYPPIVEGPEAVESGGVFHAPQTLFAAPPTALALDIRSQHEQGPTNTPSPITRVHPAAATIPLSPPPVPDRTAIPTVVDHSTSSPRRRRRRRRRASCTCSIPTHVYAALVDFVGYVSIAGRFLLVTFLCL